MASRKQKREQEPFIPPWYEATDRIFWYNPEAGAMPLLAHLPGDRVTPEDVTANHWQDKVRVPDIFEGGELPPDPEDSPADDMAEHADDSTQALDPAAEDNAASVAADEPELPFDGREGVTDASRHAS